MRQSATLGKSSQNLMLAIHFQFLFDNFDYSASELQDNRNQTRHEVKSPPS